MTKLSTREIRRYGNRADVHPVPNLNQLQTACYKRFLQKDVAPEDRVKLVTPEKETRKAVATEESDPTEPDLPW